MDPKEAVKIQKGDYSVHVFIESGRSLLPLEGETIDPIITLKLFGKSRSTKPMHRIGSSAIVTWNEHIYFEKSNAKPQEIQQERLRIELRDHNLVFKDSLVGCYEMDLTYVYYQENHALLHQWIVLSNPQSEDFQIVRGYLKVGVAVLQEQDKPVDLTIQNKLPGDEELLMPPQIKPRTKQLIIQFLKADSLPIMDSGGTIDAFCVAKFAGAEQKTSIKVADEATMNVYWYEEVYLPVMQPCVSSKFYVNLWDYDRVAFKNDLVGSFSFNWGEIEKGSYKDYFWANIYGADPSCDNEEATLMNNVEELASYWRGRILMRIWVEDIPKAVLKTSEIIEPKLEETIRDEFETGFMYELRAQVFSAVGLPSQKQAYKIRIQWCDIMLETAEIKAFNYCCSWYQNLKRLNTVVPNKADEPLPDIFVYLRKGSQNICYARLKPEEFSDIYKEEKWIRLKPDKAMGAVKNDWEGGFVKIRVYTGRYDDELDLNRGNWNTEPNPSGKNKKILLCHLFQCRNLPAADSTGTSDPYAVFYCAGAQASTAKDAKLGTLNPIWYETLALEVEIGSLETSPPIIVYLWDYDKAGADDLMGMCVVDMKKVSEDTYEAPRPEWYKLNMGTKDSEEGEVLLSFNLVDPGYPELFSIVPETIEATVEINILGLRDLKPSVGWMPVNKAFLSINLNSLQLPGESLLFNEISTQPFEPGPNPDINTVLSFTCKLPYDPLYCPTLTATVHDYLFYGLSQPILGTFSIPLGDFLFKKKPEKAPKKQNRIRTLGFEFYEEEKEDQPLLARTQVADTSVLSVSEAKDGTMITRPAQFVFDENKKRLVEVNKPLESEPYIALGYNREPQDGLKHYRYYVNSPLEESVYIGESPFNEYNILKGQTRGLDGVFDTVNKLDTKGQKSNTKVTGKFKGVIRIKCQESLKRAARNPPLSSIYDQAFKDEFEEVSKMLLNKSEFIVRVYIIDASDLEKKDIGSESDPYLVLKLGSIVINDRENYQTDEPNPKIYRHFDLPVTLPGASTLKIQVWDYDSILTDDKIGTTKIDLEDRYFSKDWRELTEKPVENRPLYIKSSRRPQGYLRLWLEIHSASVRPDPVDISPKPPTNFEARLIIWRSEEVPAGDIEGVSDLYVRAWVDSNHPKETDTHLRCQRGRGSWNWRLKFPVSVSESSNHTLNLQLWDKDFLSPNDMLGDACISFNEIAREAWESGKNTCLSGPSEDLKNRILKRNSPKFWAEFYSTNNKGEKKYSGKVLISFELVPEARARAVPVGEGRDKPNMNPYLPPPTGRFELSWNPLKIISQFCGPEFKVKICLMICFALCIVLLILMFPMVLSDAISSAIFG